MITRKLSDLRIRNEDPGGFSSVTLSLHEPLDSDEVRHFDRVLVYDAQTAEVVGAGRLEDPGKSADEAGEVWELTAIGMGPAHTEDVERGYVAIETHLEGFRRVFRGNGPGSTAEVGSAVGDDEALFFQFPGGMDLVDGTAAALQNNILSETDQNLGAYKAEWDCGGNQSNTDIQMGTDSDPDNDSHALDTGGGVFNSYISGPSTPIPAGDKKVRVRLRHNTSSVTVANDTHWASVTNISIHAQLHEKDGTALVFGAHVYDDRWVRASEIVEDLLGIGRLPLFDGENATVETTTHHINQFAYADPVKVRDLLDDLMTLESGFTWHVWGPSKFDPDLWQFEWIDKSTTIRYEASVVDGFSRPSSAAEVYDEVAVRWRDSRGRTRQTIRTATDAGVDVPLLDDLNLSRTASLDLADELGTVENAERAGDRFLIDHAYPPNQGSLRVARPIIDLTAGRMVNPSHIRSGELIRIRGVEAYPDALNASDRDGVAVFRIRSAEFTESDGAADLELDSYSQDEARMIAQLARRRSRKQ